MGEKKDFSQVEEALGLEQDNSIEENDSSELTSYFSGIKDELQNSVNDINKFITKLFTEVDKEPEPIFGGEDEVEEAEEELAKNLLKNIESFVKLSDIKNKTLAQMADLMKKRRDAEGKKAKGKGGEPEKGGKEKGMSASQIKDQCQSNEPETF